jgi:hypothetical protein
MGLVGQAGRIASFRIRRAFLPYQAYPAYATHLASHE